MIDIVAVGNKYDDDELMIHYDDVLQLGLTVQACTVCIHRINHCDKVIYICIIIIRKT